MFSLRPADWFRPRREPDSSPPGPARSALESASSDAVRRVEDLLCRALDGDDTARQELLEAASDVSAVYGPTATVPFSPAVGEALDRAPQDRRDDLWAMLAEAVSTAAPPSATALQAVQADEEHDSGAEFAEFVEEMGGGQSTNFSTGRAYLRVLLSPLPTVDEGRARVMFDASSMTALRREDESLARLMASKGMTPTTFRDAADVVGRVLRKAIQKGGISGSFTILGDGTLQRDGSLPDQYLLRAVSAFCGFGDRPTPASEALLSWLVSASEEDPELFRYWEAEYQNGRTTLRRRDESHDQAPGWVIGARQRNDC